MSLTMRLLLPIGRPTRATAGRSRWGALVGRTFDMGGGYGLDLGIGPYWNVVKPDGGADWFIKFQVSVLFPD